MTEFEKFEEIIHALRAPGGCPWDREQTHESLKAPCIEEAAEVLCGINLLGKTGDASNLQEELGDLLLQIVMHAVIAEEEGLFTMDDVIRTVSEKMIRRHPHVFGSETVENSAQVLQNWEEIKKQEKAQKEREKAAGGKDGPAFSKAQADRELAAAFDEAQALIEVARRRKGLQ